MSMIQVAVRQRYDSQNRDEIDLLRWALSERQAQDPDAPLTTPEIRLRALDQERAARGIANGWAKVNCPRKAAQWNVIADCFQDAAARLVG